MERITRLRVQILVAIFGLIIAFFAFKLYDLQIIETGGNTDNTTTFTTKTRVKAARGDILDRNGNLLVSNRASYDLVINHFVLITASGTSDHLYRLVKRCEEAGVTYEDSFPISRSRPFTYTLDEMNSTRQGYFQRYLSYLGGLDSDITAPVLVDLLRQRYELPAQWTDEEARAVLGLWYELDLRRCVDTLSNYVFKADVNDEDLAAIAELNIPGLNVEASTVREYNTKYAAHILGYVGPMTAEQWEDYKDNEDYSMDSHIGQDGIEKAFEEYLHGVDGWRLDTVATDGTLISSKYITEPKAGSNVELTIDINLQRQAEDLLAATMENLRVTEEEAEQLKADGVETLPDGHDAEGAAVVSIDTRTGGVLVCASYPTYDLSTFFENYKEILETENDPLFNRALQGTYPPGSTYKMSMVVASIQAGLISSSTPIYDAGVFSKYAPGFAPKCLLYSSKRSSHGSINAAEALQVSCNYFFYDLGDRIGLKSMDDTAKAMGLGEKTGVELAEKIGYRANEETKKKLYKGDTAKFFQADKISAAIGQADNRFTPMQLCVYASTLANKGTRYKATFLSRVVSADYRQLLLRSEKTIAHQMDISDDAYVAYSTGMNLVTKYTNLSGTAAKIFNTYPIEICAKTGTAQTGSNVSSDHGAFVCYAPMAEPEIAIAIYGEKAGHGSSMAEVAKGILDVYFEVGEAGEVPVYENQAS